jgi:hypothetical protein
MGSAHGRQDSNVSPTCLAHRPLLEGHNAPQLMVYRTGTDRLEPLGAKGAQRIDEPNLNVAAHL